MLPIFLEERVIQVRQREGRLLILAATFVGTSSLALSLVVAGRPTLAHLWPTVLWGVAILLVHLLFNSFLPLRDPLILPIVSLLAGWGLILIDRLAANFLPRQSVWVCLGLAAVVILALFPRSRPGDLTGLRWLRRYRYTWLVLGLVLLGFTLFFGVNPSGADLRFWLGLRLPLIGGVYFQPSELLKLLMVLYLASYMAEKREFIEISFWQIGRFRFARPPLAYLAPLLLMWGLSLVLLGLQKDLGAAILFFLVFLIMLYLASGRWEAMASGLGLMAATIALVYFLPLGQLDIVRLRIDTWLNPWPEAQGRAFQIVQSLLAVAAGGVLGQGVGQGYPTYIPVVHSDFVFSAVAEEWGLLGALSVVLCLAVLVYRALRLATLSQRPYARFLAAGLAALIGVQILIILGGVTKLLPLTGITLPFMSYGGSSFLVSSMMVGLLLKISAQVEAR